MYDEKYYDAILESMKTRINGSVSTEEGTLVHFALAPAAAELEELYNNLEVADLNGSILTCDREHLIIFGEEYNIPIKSATNSVWLARFNVDFELGERFEAGDMTYISIARVAEREYQLKCETAGIVGNMKPDDELLPIEFIEEYDYGELIELIEPAMSDEETEVYRTRLLEKRKEENGISGNRADYKKFIKSLAEVGGVKQERATQECKRIKTYIISSTWRKPSDEIVRAVQQAVDPIGKQGEGEGKAPFWHVVDICPVNTINININADFELLPGHSFDEALPEIENAVENYITELNKTWEDTEKDGLVVRLLKIADTMLTVEGIEDIRNIQINGQGNNIELDRNTIPVKGAITNAE